MESLAAGNGSQGSSRDSLCHRTVGGSGRHLPTPSEHRVWYSESAPRLAGGGGPCPLGPAEVAADRSSAFGNEDLRASDPSPICFGVFFSLSILISKLYHHLIPMCSFLKAVHHINGSVYRCEHSACTVICNPLIATSCTLLVHIQFNL